MNVILHGHNLGNIHPGWEEHSRPCDILKLKYLFFISPKNELMMKEVGGLFLSD